MDPLDTPDTFYPYQQHPLPTAPGTFGSTTPPDSSDSLAGLFEVFHTALTRLLLSRMIRNNVADDQDSLWMKIALPMNTSTYTEKAF